MRDILFKGKVIEAWTPSGIKQNEWAYGNYVHYCKNKMEFSYIVADDGTQYMCDPDTICQYTGMMDKNGKKIFEGDIVRTKYGRLCLAKYICLPGYVGFDFDAVECKNKCPDKYDVFLPSNLEVIGNIHDNPELLE